MSGNRFHRACSYVRVKLTKRVTDLRITALRACLRVFTQFPVGRGAPSASRPVPLIPDAEVLRACRGTDPARLILAGFYRRPSRTTVELSLRTGALVLNLHSLSPCMRLRVLSASDALLQTIATPEWVLELARNAQVAVLEESKAESSIHEGREELETLARSQRTRKSRPLEYAAVAHSRVGPLLVASHDLKFLSGYVDHLTARGTDLSFDHWSGHSRHDRQSSLRALANASTILCEWGLGNAVWYSRHKKPHQVLIIRVHSQELRTPFLRNIDHSKVDLYIFVAEHIRESAIISHGVPREKSVVVPNAVDTARFAAPAIMPRPKAIAFVGPVPRSKRLDRALDVIEQVLAVDPDYRLRIKGKKPEEYAWAAADEDDLRWFGTQMKRIEKVTQRYPGAVTWESFGDDLPEFYAGCKWVLSLSDMESFHYSVAEGAAAGVNPLVLAWKGADLLYPEKWMNPSVSEIVDRIIADVPPSVDSAKFIRTRYGQETVFGRLDHYLGTRD